MSDTPLLNSSAVASRFDEVVPTLTEAQMARVAAHGHVRQVERGQVLVEAGERASRDRFGGTWRALAVLLPRQRLCGILISPAPTRSHQEDDKSNPLGDEALDQLFREARTHNAWLDRPVTDDTLRQLYDFLSFAAGLGYRLPVVSSES